MKNLGDERSAGLLTLLKSEFTRRIEFNKHYSLRAFARDLGIDASDLSKVLNGKKVIGKKMGQLIASKLGFTIETVFDKEYTEDPYDGIALNSFVMISDWYHYAILELIKLPSFDGTPEMISRKLGVSLQVAQEAIDRLISMDMIERCEKGFIDKTNGNTTTIKHEFTTTAFKNHQVGLLNKAIKAIDEFPMNERDQSSMTMATSSEKIKMAKVMIKQFRRKLCHFLEDTEDKNTVFNLSISLYPLIKEEEK